MIFLKRSIDRRDIMRKDVSNKINEGGYRYFE